MLSATWRTHKHFYSSASLGIIFDGFEAFVGNSRFFFFLLKLLRLRKKCNSNYREMQLKCSLSSLLGFILFFATILKSLNILQMAKPRRRRSKWNFTFYDLSNAMCLELREKIQFKFFNCHLWYLVLVGMCCSDKPILWLSTRQFFQTSFFSSIFYGSGPVECNFLGVCWTAL